jgi:syntaxin-binding protein 1
LLAILGEYPFIRYHTPDTGMNSASLPGALATKVQSAIDSLSRKDPSYPPHSSKERGVLLIVERGCDVATPLLHEFTYQAFIADVLGVQAGKYTTDEGKEVIIDENDGVWVKAPYSFAHEAIFVEFTRLNYIL